MKLSDRGRQLIKDSECGEGNPPRLVAYLPTKDDVPTIGWGHTKGVKMGMTCTVEQAEQFLTADVAQAEKDVTRLVKVPLTQNQFDALGSLFFNVGVPATLLRMLNAKDYRGAADQFDEWVHQKGKVVSGLKKRRAKEKKLFLEV